MAWFASLGAKRVASMTETLRSGRGRGFKRAARRYEAWVGVSVGCGVVVAVDF